MARITADDPPEALAEISYTQFYNLVDAELRKKIDPNVAQKLRHPAVAIRWHQVLTQMRRNAEGSIAIRASEYRASRLITVQKLSEAERALAALRDAPESTRHKAAESVERNRMQLRELAREFEEWRVRTLRFKAGVEEKLTEAQWARDRAAREILEEVERTASNLELVQTNEILERLREAVRLHRAEIDPRDASDVDGDLWAVLDEIDGPVDGQAEVSIGDEVRRLLGRHRDR